MVYMERYRSLIKVEFGGCQGQEKPRDTRAKKKTSWALALVAAESVIHINRYVRTDCNFMYGCIHLLGHLLGIMGI